MNSKLTKEEIEKLRNVRIHNLLSKKDIGKRVIIRCPVHDDSTPSFNLYPDNTFFCFGCRISGKGAIDFLEKFGYSFNEIIEELKKYV